MAYLDNTLALINRLYIYGELDTVKKLNSLRRRRKHSIALNDVG